MFKGITKKIAPYIIGGALVLEASYWFAQHQTYLADRRQIKKSITYLKDVNGDGIEDMVFSERVLRSAFLFDYPTIEKSALLGIRRRDEKAGPFVWYGTHEIEVK